MEAWVTDSGNPGLLRPIRGTLAPIHELPVCLSCSPPIEKDSTGVMLSNGSHTWPTIKMLKVKNAKQKQMKMQKPSNLLCCCIALLCCCICFVFFVFSWYHVFTYENVYPSEILSWKSNTHTHTQSYMFLRFCLLYVCFCFNLFCFIYKNTLAPCIYGCRGEHKTRGQ